MFHLYFEGQGPLGSNLPKKKPCEFVEPSGEIQAYPFPYKINFSDFHCLFNLSWYHMGRGEEESFSSLKCFSALVRISPCGTFKKFKTNKAILTIVIGLKKYIASESSKVCSG